MGLFAASACSRERGSEQAGEQTAWPAPVRVPREFLEDPALLARVQLLGESDVLLAEEERTTRWVSKPPSAPPPTGDFIADFRDFEACSWFAGQRRVGLCFQVMPDVSSVEISEGNSHPEGLERWVEHHLHRTGPLPCEAHLRSLRIEEARKAEDEPLQRFTVVYRAIPDEACGERDLRVRVILTRD